MLAVTWPLDASGTVLVQNGCSLACQLVRLDQVPTTLKFCFGRSCATAAPTVSTATDSAIDATNPLTISKPPFPVPQALFSVPACVAHKSTPQTAPCLLAG